MAPVAATPRRPVPAGRGAGKRFARPADNPDPRFGRPHAPAQPG